MYTPPDRRAGAVLAEPTRAARTLDRPPRPEARAWGGACRTASAGPGTFRGRATREDPRTTGCRRAPAPASGCRRPPAESTRPDIGGHVLAPLRATPSPANRYG